MTGRDDEEFLAFVAQASERLLRLGWMLTGNRGTAEDLVQGALERVYVAWPRIEPVGRVAYARRVVVNLDIDSRRRRRREVVVAEVPEVPTDAGPEAVVSSLALAEALATLPQRQRQCVVLRHHADLPELEVAELLGISVGTVKSSTFRGLAKLRALLVLEGEPHV